MMEHRLDAINRETLNFWREDAGMYQPMALGVEQKVEAGEPLNSLEQQVLNLGLTAEQVEFVTANLFALNGAQC